MGERRFWKHLAGENKRRGGAVGSGEKRCRIDREGREVLDRSRRSAAEHGPMWEESWKAGGVGPIAGPE